MALGYRCRTRERQERWLGRVLAPKAFGMTERPSHIVAGLITKRAELAGVIAELERQRAQDRADLTHIDGVLRVLASDLDPETIKPRRRLARHREFTAASRALPPDRGLGERVDLQDAAVRTEGLAVIAREADRDKPSRVHLHRSSA
jgi:hypothetical protein